MDMMSCVDEPSSAPLYFNSSQANTSPTVLLTIHAFPRKIFPLLFFSGVQVVLWYLQELSPLPSCYLFSIKMTS